MICEVIYFCSGLISLLCFCCPWCSCYRKKKDKLEKDLNNVLMLEDEHIIIDQKEKEETLEEALNIK